MRIAQPSNHSRFLTIADFCRYDVYDRAIANYRKRHGKAAVESATGFRFHLIDDRLYFTLEASETPVAYFEVCLVGEGVRYRLKAVDSLPEVTR